ncbi:MAG: hypothetical protein KF752_15270 [Pirellulaceae bacterium]|nr:hypothetical protein [Pirellulaceae bacterium]
MSHFAQHDGLSDTQPYQPANQTPQWIEAEPPRRRSSCGCLAVGCLVVLLLVMGAVGLAVYSGYSFYQQQLQKYTSETPVELPGVTIDDAQIQATVDRLEQFREQFDEGSAPQELVLTIEELNALIANNPELRGRVYVSVVDGDLRAEVSFPVDKLPGGRGRYFNGSATMHVELQDGVLIVHAVSAEANGQPVPEQLMGIFKQENLARDLYKDVQISKTLQRCEQLIIEPERIILKVRQKPPRRAGETPPGVSQPDQLKTPDTLGEEASAASSGDS